MNTETKKLRHKFPGAQYSSLSGGEIYVDGKFFGNAPSDIALASGEHVVRVTLGGKEWTRAVTVTGGGEIQLHAELP